MAGPRDANQEGETGEPLEARERRFRALIEHSWDAIALFGPDGTIVYGSPATTRILGYPLAEFVGRSAFEFIHPDDHPLVLERLSQALARPAEGVDVHARVRHRDGSWRLLEGLFTNLLDDPAVGAIVNNYRDATEKTRLQEALLEARKMEAVGRLAGGVAHDFNNLLGVIIGYGQMLLTRLPADSESHANTREILEAAQRAAGLTRQLLAFGRKQVVQPRLLDLNALITNLDRMLQPMVGEGVARVLTLDDALPPIEADPGQLELILMNLAVNARDAMPGGGTLILETRTAQIAEGDARGLRPGPYVVLTVSDTGVGMDAETRAHAFEPFFTTKGVGQGPGLGLATVYGAVQQCGGHVSVRSEPGRGTTFEIFLPAAASASAPPAPPPSPAIAPGGTETILVVEDEPMVRELVRDTLTDLGYFVLAAGDGAHAVEISEAHKGPLHLLLTDVVMPGLGGRKVADHLTRARPGLRVLFMSGHSDDTISKQGALEPGLALIQKPFKPDELARRLRELLD